MVIISIFLIPMTHAYSSGTASFRPAYHFYCNITATNGAIAGDAIWEGPQTCGANYSIVCTGSAIAGLPCPCKANQSVVVMIVAQCLAPPITICSVTGSTFLLNAQAFSQITTYPNPN
ncbi:hypothetical protein RHMOL_Rhmol01G0012600 [Rhododendron molle]|uniref:Uncharacterized protein n=1 Tax=Rhododendron molle TaxID=49168 RepID=A0ACC0PYA5_RHOML|nr:hypothetical protein RHMOL_Rhmol01G0012600 [Rhododendron molle]